MHEIEMIFEEVYSVERTVYVKMDDNQYRDYINGDNPIEGILKKSSSVFDFVNKCKKRKGRMSCINVKSSQLRNDMKHKVLKYFDLDYQFKKNRGDNKSNI